MQKTKVNIQESGGADFKPLLPLFESLILIAGLFPLLNRKAHTV
jgi:hypothetical protein